MNKFIPGLFIFLLGTAAMLPQNINGRFSSSLYAYETSQYLDTSEVYNSSNSLRAFQLLSLNINQDKFALRTSMNFETDLSADLEGDPRLRFYNLYLEGRDLFGLATIKLGRQNLYANVGSGLIDGVDLTLKKGNYKLNGFYGGNVPAYQKLELNDNWSDNYIFGGRFTAAPINEFQISLGYISKNYKPDDYFATRLDPDLNPLLVLVEGKSNQYRYGFAEADYEMKRIFSVNTKYEYDFNFEETSRFEFLGSYKQLKNISINVYYNYREPQVRYNSIFSVFDYGNSQEIEGGIDYTLNSYLTFSGKFGFTEYKDDNSKRVTIGALSPFGNLTYRKNFGFAGEMDALSLYTAHSFLEGLITPHLGVSYTTYKLSKDDDENELVSVLAGTNFRPFRTLSFDLQGQFMNNKIYKNDYRLFFKVNYWFNTNLNWM